MNKAMSLVVVITALPARLIAVPLSQLTPYTYVVVNLLAGSLVGAWLGATWATRIRSALLYKIIAGLLVFIAAALAASHLAELSTLDLAPLPRAILGFFAGIAIGAVAAVMGVAGGELLIPTITLLYAVDIKIAGSLSLCRVPADDGCCVARYSRDRSLQSLREKKAFSSRRSAPSRARCSVVFCSALSLPSMLIPLLVLLLVISAVRDWQN